MQADDVLCLKTHVFEIWNSLFFVNSSLCLKLIWNVNTLIMAEFVDLRLEEMLPELEQMQRVELFNDQEIKYDRKKFVIITCWC